MNKEEGYYVIDVFGCSGPMVAWFDGEFMFVVGREKPISKDDFLQHFVYVSVKPIDFEKLCEIEYEEPSEWLCESIYGIKTN